MYEPPPGYKTAFRTTKRKECLEFRLVLIAMGISVKAVHHDKWWYLIVEQDDLAVAAAELDTYHRENSDQSSGFSKPVPLYGGAVAAVFAYLGTVILIDVLTVQRAFGLDWFRAGQMQAGRVMAGEWWRTATALTLHLDVGHIIANLLFGAVFGFLAGRVLGGGVAWLAIVIAGAVGNFMNAIVQAPTHTSIGASTAVFAALGVIVSHALRPRTSDQQKPLKRWAPLVGGVLLLAFIGIGDEHTDVVAHLTGFLSGLSIGWVGCRLPNDWLAQRAIQTGAAIGTIAIVAFAWIVGLIVAG